MANLKAWRSAQDTTLEAIINDLCKLCPKDVLPNIDELKSLVTERNASTWISVVEGLHQSDSVPENDGIFETRNLSEELLAVDAAIVRMDREVTQLQEEVSQLAAEKDQTNKMSASHVQKAMLLSAYSLDCNEKCNILDCYADQLQKTIQVPSSKEKTFYQCSQSSEGVVLESACLRSLRQLCKSVEEVLMKRESCDLSHDFKSSLQALYSTFPPSDLVESFIEYVSEGQSRLLQLIHSVDLQKDADELSCACSESGSWSDLSDAPSLEEIIEQHLRDVHLVHIKSNLGHRVAQSQLPKLHNRLENLQKNLEQTLAAKFSNHSEEAIEIYSSVLHLEKEVCGYNAAKQYMETTLDCLSSKKKEQASLFRSLQEKHQHIYNFTKEVEKKEMNIQEYVRYNGSMQHKLQRKQKEIALLRRQTICIHELPLTTTLTSLQDTLAREAEVFMSVQLSNLHKSQRDQFGLPNIQDTKLLLGQPVTLPDEDVLPCLAESLLKAEVLSSPPNTCVKKDENDMKVLLAEMDQLEVEEKELLVSLTGDLTASSQLVEECTKLSNYIEQWWTCPSQHLLPWVTRGGMNFSDWMKQWNLLANKLRMES